MNVTMTLQRQVSPEELDEDLVIPRQPLIAGAPLEILGEWGVKTKLSAKPCEDPLKEYIIEGRNDLWQPIDCGDCPSCTARSLEL